MMDLVSRSDRLPGPGETVLGTSFETVVGGKGFNQAVAAARSGASVSFVGRVGADPYGAAFLAQLAAEGIDAAGVVIDAAVGTGVGLPRVDAAGQNSIVVVPRANMAMTPDDIDVAADLIEGASVVLLQLEIPLACVARAAELARRAGALVLLNPAPAAAGFFVPADVVIPNESEAAALSGLPLGTDDAELAAAVRYAVGADRVVLTVGERGVVVVGPDGVSAESGHAVDCIDTVGAGDAFCGALAARLAAGASFDEAVRFGNAAGALAVTRPGGAPAMPSSAEVAALLGSGQPIGTGPKASAAISASSTKLQ
jgi:ribokinase